MSSNTFDQLAGPLSKVQTMAPYFEKNVKYGISAKVDFEVESEYKDNFQRPGALFTNVVTPFGKLSMHAIKDVADFSGINAKVINEYGAFDANMLADLIKSSNRFKPGETTLAAYNVANNVMESHVGVIFNLLRLKIYAEVKHERLAFKQDGVAYDDGHVNQTWRQFLGTNFQEEIELEFDNGLPIDYYLPNVNWSSGEYCVNTAGFIQQDMNILAIAVAGWKTNCAVRLFSGSPRLADKMLVGYGHTLPSVSYGIEKFNADDVMRTMNKFITVNRLSAQFDLAYAMVVMSMFTPLPRAVEANAWVSPVHRFGIPRAESVRGMIPEILSETPYNPKPATEATWANYKINPNRIYVHGMAVCEAMYTGLYEVLTNSSGTSASGWLELGVDGAGDMRPYRIMMECVSLRWGKKFDLLHNNFMGPDMVSTILTMEEPQQRPIEVSIIGDAQDYMTYDSVVGDQVVTRIRSPTARPVMFPVLSMGVNDHRYYINSLAYEAEMTYDAYNGVYSTNDHTQANKMLVALRVMGYDAEIRDTFTGMRYKNWAANANGQVMPDVKKTALNNTYVMAVTSMVSRKNNWGRLMHTGGQLKIKVKITPKTYALFLDGKKVSLGIVQYNPVTQMPVRPSTMAVTTAQLQTAGNFNEYIYQSFYLRETGDQTDPEPSTSQPVATAELLRRDMLSHGDGDQDIVEETEI